LNISEVSPKFSSNFIDGGYDTDHGFLGQANRPNNNMLLLNEDKGYGTDDFAEVTVPGGSFGGLRAEAISNFAGRTQTAAGRHDSPLTRTPTLKKGPKINV